MFATLLESPAPRERRASGTLASVAVHGAILALALTASHEVSTARQTLPPETIAYVEPPAPLAAVPAPAPAAATIAAVRPPAGFTVLSAPVVVPDVLPGIDLSRAVTDEARYTGRGGIPGGVPGGVRGAPPVTGGLSGVWTLEAVEKAAVAIAGAGIPEYPPLLRDAGIDGTVRIRFVIDTMGRAEVATLVVLASNHELFTRAVERAVPRMRFLPAEVGGRRVRQLVELPLVFSVR